MSTVVKACGCGRTYTAEEWAALELVGIMADDVETIELRNCPCGSTIAVEASESCSALHVQC